MIKISITQKTIIIKFEGYRKFLTLKNNLRIPLSCIKSVSTQPVKWLIFTPKIGTNFPGLIMAGTFFRKEGTVFYFVRDLKECLTLALHNHRYSKVIIQVDDKNNTAREIRKVLKEFHNQ